MTTSPFPFLVIKGKDSILSQSNSLSICQLINLPRKEGGLFFFGFLLNFILRPLVFFHDLSLIFFKFLVEKKNQSI